MLSKHSHILLESQGYLLHFEDECTLKMRDVNDMSRSRKKKPVFHFEIPRKYAIKINILVYAVRKKTQTRN